MLGGDVGQTAAFRDFISSFLEHPQTTRHMMQSKGMSFFIVEPLLIEIRDTSSFESVRV
jgi:hypothetical protein